MFLPKKVMTSSSANENLQALCIVVFNLQKRKKQKNTNNKLPNFFIKDFNNQFFKEILQKWQENYSL